MNREENANVNVERNNIPVPHGQNQPMNAARNSSLSSIYLILRIPLTPNVPHATSSGPRADVDGPNGTQPGQSAQ